MFAATTVAMVSFLSSMTARAQARPDVPGRIWGEFGIARARHDGTCNGCSFRGSVSGAAITASAGLTVDHGLGIAVAGRIFQSLSFDFSRSGKYALALGQYTPSVAPAITLNAGGGYGSHSGDGVPSVNGNPTSRAGAVVSLGVAVRMMPRSRGALALTADMIRSVSGPYRPNLFALGLAINVSSGEPYEGRR